ncbi:MULTISPECIES: HK97 family phage prohead protease [unclassified Streptomyces]|uniref:HK97 family phage prohead protease n=1 Tax=unclassified Streptomyces TaxID=2593676 RepID=UPI0003704484|nr:HK97 family phage prohead protease [Streptomyces sp. ScaeMP-e10]
MRTKDFTARVKAAGTADGLAEGQFVALVSVFGNEDSVGDVVKPGAFTETLTEWGAKGDPIPVIWAHKWGDPFAHVGRVIKAVETLEGLEVTGQIDDLTGDDENPTAKQVYRLLKGRRVTQFSFAYDELKSAWVKDDNHRWGGYWELQQLKLHEVGPCLVGANQETELLAAKAEGLARGAKAGRVLSQANYDSLAAAHASIGEVLAAATPEDSKARTESGRPGPAADGNEPSAKPETPPAKDATGADELEARIARLVAAELAKSSAVNNDNSSSANDETTTDLRDEQPTEGELDAKAAAASSRLRTELGLLELDLSLTE